MTHLSFLRPLIVLFALALPVEIFAQCMDLRDAPLRTNAGLEFLLAFQDNDASNETEPEVYQEIYMASAGSPARVTITSLHDPTFIRTLDLAANEARSVRLDSVLGFMIRTTLVTQQIIKVLSDKPIVCYGLNHKRFSADAFVALPRNVAGNEFRVMAYRNSRRIPTYARPSQFAVAAFEDNTKVVITPTAPTQSGQSAGVPYTITLNAAEGIQVQSEAMSETSDLTGSIIQSDKPITVFGGHSRAEIPSNSGNSSDHLAESIPPVHTWGRKFIVTDYPFPGTTQPDLIRVLALDNNTRVSINGVEWTTLGENEYRDSLYKGTLQIEATGPVLVGTYAHTTGDGTASQLGDPFFLLAPPLEQTYTDFTFFNSSDPVYTQHFAIIVAETSNKGNIELDGSLVPALAFRDLPAFFDGKQYSIARVGIGSGFHTVKTRNLMENGVIVMAYGMGQIDSYGYTAASLFRPTNALRAVKHSTSGPVLPEHRNELILENITDQTVYLDGAEIELHGDTGIKYQVKLRENIVFDVRTLGRQERLKLHFDVHPPLTEQVTGVVRFRTRTSKWEGLYPSVCEFTLRPESQASVDEFLADSDLDIRYSGQNSAVIRFKGSGASATVKLYDAIGRRIMTLHDGVTIAGEQSFTISRDEFPSGFYMVEVTSGSSPSIRKGFTLSQ